MADPAIQFLLENVKEFIVYHGRLIKHAETEAKSLDQELALFKAKLYDSSATNWQQGNTATAKEWVNQIRTAVYEMEDAIDDSVAKRGHIIKSKSFWVKAYRNISMGPQLINVAKEVQDLKTLANKIYERRQAFALGSPTTDNHDHHTQDWTDPLEEDDIIGFEEDEKIICNYLREEKDEVDVISIVGMPGIGKTKLARKIFNDMEKKEAKEKLFSTCIMVYLSPYEYKIDVVLREMLDKFPDGLVSAETRAKAKEKKHKDIAVMVKEHLLKSKSFLLVLDNVWDTMVWNQLKAAFPKTHRAGKILITTQNEQVCVSASSSSKHKLPLLQHPQSLKLLNLAAFGKNNQCPESLNLQATVIASKCGGLPHLIVTIGDCLKEICGDEDEVGGVSLQPDTWTKVSEDLTACLRLNDDFMKKFLFPKYSLCYNSLPHNLRPCFLYLGIFPQDYKIPVAMLLQLWIAEGFIPAAKEGSTPEDTADAYLRDLIRRNLVIVDEECVDGRPKKCHLHFMLREFCIVEASVENENFFQDAKSSEQRLPRDLRRVTIDSRVIDFLSKKQTGPRVRSFLYFSEEDANVDEDRLGDEHISSIPAAFKWLRVFAAQPIVFKELPSNQWIKLVHLRFVLLSIDSKVIPKDISRLWNMQTFVVYTKSKTLDIKANTWKMEKLRHVKTNKPTKLPSATKGKEGKNLHTLGTILDESCTEEMFTRADKLKKLGIQGKLTELIESNRLAKLKQLEKLKLVSSIGPNSRDKSWGLPQGLYLPPKLKRLTLCNTGFPWKDMSILGNMDCLQILKLKEGAFMGDIWAVRNCDFHELLVLHIEDTNLCTWSLHGDTQFPKLKRLFLRKCEKLQQFPLAQMKKMERLSLKGVSGRVYEITKACGWTKKQKEGGEDADQNGEEFLPGY